MGKDLSLSILSLLILQFDSYAQYVCRDLGDDDTNEIQTAIDKFDHVIVPNTSVNWRTAPLELRDGVTLQLQEGVILWALADAYGGSSVAIDTSVINIYDVTGVTIEGLGAGATIQMLIADYNEGQWRHCIGIKGSENIRIENLVLAESGGDGVYIGPSRRDSDCETIDIIDVICDANARQGISIISARDVNITDSVFRRTGQKNHDNLAPEGPWAGIDLEPDFANHVFQQISIRDCIFEDNDGSGIEVNFFHSNDVTPDISITIADCVIRNCQRGIHIANRLSATIGGFVDISNCNVKNTREAGIIVRNWMHGNADITIEGCRLENATENRNYGAIEIRNWSAELLTNGNISMTNMEILHNLSHYLVRLDGGGTIRDVTCGIRTDDTSKQVRYNCCHDNVAISIAGN